LRQEADSGERQERTEQSAPSSDLANASASFFAQQASVVTMMTAFGMNLSAQMAGAFMGAFAKAIDHAEAARVDPVADSVPDPKPDAKKLRTPTAKVVPLRVVKTDRAPVADDLKKISGVGPRLEKVLNGMGIRTWAQIARWTEADMREIDDKLGLENRVLRDDWATQAKALLEG
jgi:NADH-quinone oxidoreductase subunit E